MQFTTSQIKIARRLALGAAVYQNYFEKTLSGLLMKEKDKEQPIRGFIFACTNKTEGECFERLLFGAQKTYAPIVFRIRKGDLLFLNNLDTDILYGVFKAVSAGDLYFFHVESALSQISANAGENVS